MGSKHCNETLKPDIVRPCILRACPAWQVGAWSGVSVFTFFGRNIAKRRNLPVNELRFNECIICQYFVLPCRTPSWLSCYSCIWDSCMYEDLKRRGCI